MCNKSIKMSYLGVQDRFQSQMRSRAEFIDKENAMRFLDVFIEHFEGVKNKAILTGVL